MNQTDVMSAAPAALKDSELTEWTAGLGRWAAESGMCGRELSVHLAVVDFIGMCTW